MSVPTKTPFGKAWMTEYFAEVDRMNPDGLLRWYADDASFRFAGHPKLHGKAEIAKTLNDFYASIAGMRHVNKAAWIDPEAQSAVWEADVTYTRHDGSTISLPVMTALDLKDGLVHDVRFVMDPAPLFNAGH